MSSNDREERGEGNLLARLASFIRGITTPFWKGWSLIFRGDDEFPERAEVWNRDKEISAIGPEDGPKIFWLCGYSASVSPFKSLIARLSSQFGVTITARSLSGHDGSFWSFARSRSWHWYRDAERRFLQCYNRSGPMFVAGISTGALVAILLAVRHPDKVKGLILDATALRLAQRSNTLLLWGVLIGYHVALIAPLVAWLIFGSIPLLAWVLFASAIYSWGLVRQSSLVPPEVHLTSSERVELYHNYLPLVTTSTLPLIQLVTRLACKHVRCPALVIHGELDPVIPLDAGKEAFDRLGSKTKWFRAYRDCSHPVLLSADGTDYFDLIFAFVREVFNKEEKDIVLPPELREGTEFYPLPEVEADEPADVEDEQEDRPPDQPMQ